MCLDRGSARTQTKILSSIGSLGKRVKDSSGGCRTVVVVIALEAAVGQIIFEELLSLFPASVGCDGDNGK